LIDADLFDLLDADADDGQFNALGRSVDADKSSLEYKNNGLVVIDDFLSQAALDEMLRWMQDGTFVFYVAGFRRDCALEDAIEFHAFVPLEALACVRPLAFLSGVRVHCLLLLQP
jgi:hypothetical protein